MGYLPVFHGMIAGIIKALKRRGTFRKLLFFVGSEEVGCSTEIALLPIASCDLITGFADTERSGYAHFVHCYLYIHTLLFSYGH